MQRRPLNKVLDLLQFNLLIVLVIGLWMLSQTHSLTGTELAWLP